MVNMFIKFDGYQLRSCTSTRAVLINDENIYIFKIIITDNFWKENCFLNFWNTE